MAFIHRSSFALVLTALLASAVNGQTNINFAQCSQSEDTRARQATGFSDGDVEGSERRTYGNLCSGSLPFGDTSTETPITSRNGDPFKRFCDLIDRYPNVQSLMATGNSPHTVFAPTDAAFAKVDGLLSRVDEQRLLELHVLPQARYTRDLRCGQTYRTINTQQDRRNTQRQKTQCVSAGKTQQIGPGNTVNGLFPTIGSPNNIFPRNAYQFQDHFDVTIGGTGILNDVDDDDFSKDVTSCNGVIHVVDELLLPGGNVLSPYSYYGPVTYGAPYNTPYNTVPHSHAGYYNTYTSYYNSPIRYQSPYYGPPYRPNSYYNNYYYGPRTPRSYGSKGTKKGKGSKGTKGYGSRYGPPPPPPPPLYYNNYYFRKLEGKESKTDKLTDAEFFGTDGLTEVESSEKNEGNRKRRLEALLEPNGNIEVV